MSSEMCEFNDVQMGNEVRTMSSVPVEITCTYLLNEAVYLHVSHRGYQMNMKNASAIVWAVCITRSVHMAVTGVVKHKTPMYVLLFVTVLINSH
jgi:hypothetical protein